MEESTKEHYVLEAVKKDLTEIFDSGEDIAFLEVELDYRKRLLHKKLNIYKENRELYRTQLTDRERGEVQSFIKNQISRPLNETLNKRKRALVEQLVLAQFDVKDLKEEVAHCYFDSPQNLLVTVSYTDRPNIVIDIIKSIKNDPQNIGHPLIVQAIIRYTKIAAHSTGHMPSNLTAEKAEANLEKIFGTLVSGEKEKKRKSKKDVENFALVLNLKRFPPNYFTEAWKIMNEEGTKAILTPTNKAIRIRQRVTDLFPGFDHQSLTDFFMEAFKAEKRPKNERLLPKKSGGGDALRNAYFRWSQGGEHSSARTRLSNVRREFKEILQGGFEISEADINEFAENIVKKVLDEDISFIKLGIGSMKPYQDLSNLEQKEYPITYQDEISVQS